MSGKTMLSNLLPEMRTRTIVMGILNLTADSFSGDGLAKDGQLVQNALIQAKRFVEEGADILDLGAESTRPGYTPVTSEQEIERLVPVIRALRKDLPGVILSVDCYRAPTAEAVLKEGVDLINDIWGFKWDGHMASVVAEAGVPAALMHNRKLGKVKTDQTLGGYIEEAQYDNFLEEVLNDLRDSIELARTAGLSDDQIILDPGIGFAKNRQQNLYLLKNLETLKSLGYPILLGISRKGFIGHTLNLPREERLEGSLAANAYGVLHGANILRVHDVKATVRLARMIDAIQRVKLSD